jgi:hypothetical protein
MTKKLPLQGGEPIRGGGTSAIPETIYPHKLPVRIFQVLEKSVYGIFHGMAQIILTIKGGAFVQYSAGGKSSTLILTGKVGGKGSDGYIPPEAIAELEKLAGTILIGEWTLTLHVRDGSLYYYELSWLQASVKVGPCE